ncbi:hypothetical protein GMDG_06311 [Pseudogymnoascus destructans 20631-21]|uniref:Uncharacterized protein n=1 Tax=Pseudogymnoascus destructans (strain ATCC MYA-4855 / 20631-21) TaxID=658429 RepID=L8FT69_PSED2|nr:hypothetical protein GMDG_06311 [Pseudogymnoascus destructans 20631-21]
MSRMHTEDPPTRYKKSTISEKITPLSDGIEHTFLQWSASIRDRLVVNEYHYLTDVSRRALIWGTTTGLAKTYLEPQYLSAMHGFRSADEMMDLLGSYYLTGNETEQARNLFDDLQMVGKGYASETFPEFKAHFQSAAITGQVSESEWFQYMWNKLTPQFRSHVAIIENQWNGDYQTMDVHTYDGCSKGVSVEADSSHTCSVYPNHVPPQANDAGAHEDHSPSILRKLFQEIDRNDPEAEEQWEEAMKLQSDASLEENDEA